VSSLAFDVFRQYMLRCILSPRWHEMGLAKKVEIHFVVSLALDEIRQHM